MVPDAAEILTASHSALVTIIRHHVLGSKQSRNNTIFAYPAINI